MARKKAAAVPTPASPAQGKSFWLDPKAQANRHRILEQIGALGGRVQETIDTTLDYLVLDESRRGAKTKSPPLREAERVNKTGGSIAILYWNDLHKLLCPTREMALAAFRGGQG